MKRLKKILALALAMAMVLAMAIPALATTYGTQNQPHTITITNNGNGAHTYSAYQIFKGNLDADEDTLTDITWGSGVDGNALLAALKNASATDFPAELKSGDDSLFKDCTTAADVAKILATDAFKTAAKLDAFAKIAEANKATASAADVSESLYFLVKSGLLTRDIKGNYHQTNQSLSSGRLNVVAVAVHSLLRQMGEFALEALDKLPISERHFSGVTMGMTAESYEKVIEELTECRKRIVSIVSADKKVEKVCRLNMQLFPLSEKLNCDPTDLGKGA